MGACAAHLHSTPEIPEMQIAGRTDSFRQWKNDRFREPIVSSARRTSCGRPHLTVLRIADFGRLILSDEIDLLIVPGKAKKSV
jgi:hypothetical protein